MPTVELSKKDLEALTGKKLSQQQLENALLYVKGEVDKTDGDTVWVDVKETNRPDLWGVEGIAQELRARLGIETGMPKQKFLPSKFRVIVDENTRNIRPKVAAAIAQNVKITKEFLVSLINLQEKIANTFGRKRKEAAIGMYELEKLVFPVHYKAFGPNEIRFVPLDFEQEMTIGEILAQHPKGKEFGHVFNNSKKFPVWIDSKKTVLSLSPIINSKTTGKVKESTKNVFIEVSGLEQDKVNTALVVMAQAFAMRGAQVQTVKIQYKSHSVTTPYINTNKTTLELDHVNSIAGMGFSAKEVARLLQRAGFDAKAKGKKIEVHYPSYRQDILHAVDIIEDALISFGFDNVPAKKLLMPVFGKELPRTAYIDTVRDACIGTGLQEILTFTLTSKEKQQQKTGLKSEEFVEIANPLSSSREIFRKNLFPELLEFLNKNKNQALPQKIFEIGKTVQLDPKKETRVDEKTKLCVCLSDTNTGYSQIKSVLDAISGFLGLEYKLNELEHPAFEKGKSAEISIGEKKGLIGELSAKAMKNFGIETRTSVLELEI